MLMAILLGLTFATGDDKPGGWPELFPQLGNFSRNVYPPTVAKEDKCYSQAAVYEWLGGRFEVLTITVARDPAFKEKYSVEAMKKLKVESQDVNKKRAYLWDRMKADELDKVNCRLVVVLADDKILMIEQRGGGLELPEVAKKLDFDKVAKALENPPPKPK